MIDPGTLGSASPDRERPPTKPFSIRLTDNEKSVLRARAGSTPVGTYIRDLILSEEMQTKRQRWRTPVKDEEALARLLAALGQSRIANNLNQIAKAVNIGALPVTPETEADLSQACLAVAAMRRELIRSLGLSEGERA